MPDEGIVVRVLCEDCEADYEVKPINRTFYSSTVDFCKDCESVNLTHLILDNEVWVEARLGYA